MKCIVFESSDLNFLSLVTIRPYLLDFMLHGPDRLSFS